MSERREKYHAGTTTTGSLIASDHTATEPTGNVVITCDQAVRAETEVWPYPRLARIYWQCTCERCVADEIYDAIDISEGLPAYVEICCPDCERELRFHIKWTMPEIHSVQLMQVHDPFFPNPQCPNGR